MSKIVAAVVFVFGVVRKFIGPSDGTGANVLTTADIFKAIFGPKVVALGVALLILILQGVGAVMQGLNIPIISWLALWVGGMVIELLRRLPQYDPKLVSITVTRNGSDVATEGPTPADPILYEHGSSSPRYIYSTPLPSLSNAINDPIRKPEPPTDLKLK